ncbi:hypothetical protein IWQ62_004574 [Dispira parvispora]|uniref:Uncharacterized protein n=1 Tax=Dispira parvispora TaxID=1520584 RepID=A0A9W8ANT4_9FUNG|nr:hypothetical protein IWQ62_004574 [Dispira parvispora]
MKTSKRRNYRKKPVVEEPSINTDAVPPGSPPAPTTEKPNKTDTELVVNDLLQLRKLRKKQVGLGVQNLLQGERKKRHSKAISPGQEPLPATTAESDGDKPASLMHSFTTQTNTVDVDKHMMAFIETELQKRKTGDTPESSTATEKVPTAAEEEDTSVTHLRDTLYQIPDHLKVEQAPVHEGSALLSSSMLVGIPEVNLGIDSKIRNIETTEEAKRKLKEKGISPLPQPAPRPTSNHRFGNVRGPYRSSTMATDDLIYQRFKRARRW